MRALFWTAAAVGAGYCWPAWAGWQGPGVVAWKGAGVALLALWAVRHAGNLEGRAIAGVLALGAIGDVLLDAVGMAAGAAAFLAGHVLATWIYARNGARVPVTVAASVATGIAAFALTRDPAASVYALALGAMAGAAASSRLPARVGIGAALFVASDLLIFARMGPLADSAVPRMLIWPLYFAGQALIADGAMRALGKLERRS